MSAVPFSSSAPEGPNLRVMTSRRVAIVLFNLGGPDDQEAVRPFLFNLFNDRAIIGAPQPIRFFIAQLISRTREKLAKAREARRMSEVARRGKPASFRNGVGRKIP